MVIPGSSPAKRGRGTTQGVVEGAETRADLRGSVGSFHPSVRPAAQEYVPPQHWDRAGRLMREYAAS